MDPQDDGYYLEVPQVRQRDFEQALDEDYETAKEYALLDPVVTARIAEILVPQLQTQPKLWRYYQDLEKPIVPIVEKMQHTGVQIDADALEPLRDTLDQAITFHDNALREILRAEFKFNPRSAAQLSRRTGRDGAAPGGHDEGRGAHGVRGWLLKAIEEVDLEKIDESTDDAKRLAVIHVLRSREYAKLRTTYVERLFTDRDGVRGVSMPHSIRWWQTLTVQFQWA
jgi:DNA polymerase-1